MIAEPRDRLLIAAVAIIVVVACILLAALRRNPANRLDPGETATIYGAVPDEVDWASASFVVHFKCGKCGREHSGKIPALSGGTIRQKCDCGADLGLQVGPAKEPTQ